jgi:hypothetical protein
MHFGQRHIRALSAHSAAEFHILPDRWQHVWLVAIVSPKRLGKMDKNDCHTAWGNFKTLISSLHHYKNNACFFSFFIFIFFVFFFVILYRHLPAASHDFFNASGSGNKEGLMIIFSQMTHVHGNDTDTNDHSSLQWWSKCVTLCIKPL